MPRKVILDCDPGIDDAVAICMALFDPRLEVVAITATAGTVDAHQSSRNVQTILEILDPPRWPRLGVARTVGASDVDARNLHGDDGLGNLKARISELHHAHPAEKVIVDAIRTYPNEVSIIALGPLANVSRAISFDSDIAAEIDQILVSGGSVSGIGDVTPVADFNFYCDPRSARHVLTSPVTKTLMPLDVSRDVVFTLDFLDQLPDESSRVGRFLRRVVPYLYRSHRQQLGLESILLPSAVTLVSCLQSELFQMEEMAGDVEVAGELTAGMTVFDRRPRSDWRNNMEVAVQGDVSEIRAAILRGLRFAAQQTDGEVL